jgi:hypothetical protein
MESISSQSPNGFAPTSAPRQRKPVSRIFYDFKTQQIISKEITAAEITAAKTLAYDFDPREYKDCTTEPNKSLKSGGH